MSHEKNQNKKNPKQNKKQETFESYERIFYNQMQKNRSVSLLGTFSYLRQDWSIFYVVTFLYDKFGVYLCCYFSVAKLRINIIWSMWYHIWYTYGLVCHALAMVFCLHNVNWERKIKNSLPWVGNSSAFANRPLMNQFLWF